MMRWLNALQTPIPKQKRRRKPKKTSAAVKRLRRPARGSKAFIAFWLMHIEALHASGKSAARYAAVHQLCPRKLRRLVREFERNPPAQDWRDLRHPTAHPPAPSEAHLRYELRYDPPANGPFGGGCHLYARRRLRRVV